MSFIHSSGFAYIKNLIIGVGASVVLIGALFKIMSWPGASLMLTVGLLTEAGLFIMLGLLPPHKEYYWEKLYPGLDKHGGELAASGSNFDGNKLNSTLDSLGSSIGNIKLDTSGLEDQQSKMIGELQTMAKSMSSLKALQEADFTEIKNVTQGAGKFAAALNEAVESISESLEDTRVYKEQLTQLNKNLQSLNGVYGNVLSAMGQSK
jgi:flagellar hook-basal body complex protein FliE